MGGCGALVLGAFTKRTSAGSNWNEILDNGEKILHRSFNHYKERIKLMFDEIFTDSELSYQKIFPELNLGLPFVMSFEITS